MYKLLIADDESTILKGLSEFMPWDTVGCEVSGVAKDGHEAIEFIASSPPDIVITDIKMPRKSGIDVAQFVHVNYPKIKMIILTGFAEFEYARSALIYGVSDYELKPVSKTRLLESVKELTAKIDEERGTARLSESEGAMAPFVSQLYDIDKHIEKIREVYRKRRDLAIQTMENVFPDKVVFTRPHGGLFAWVELPDYINARNVLEKSLKQNVAFVPGGSFFPNGNKENTFRINFSNMPENRIVEGLSRLGNILKEFISERQDI